MAAPTHERMLFALFVGLSTFLGIYPEPGVAGTVLGATGVVGGLKPVPGVALILLPVPGFVVVFPVVVLTFVFPGVVVTSGFVCRGTMLEIRPGTDTPIALC